MSDDLVKRLRDGCSCNIDSSPCMAEEECRDAYEAADRIEALEAERDALVDDLMHLRKTVAPIGKLRKERDEARAEAHAMVAAALTEAVDKSVGTLGVLPTCSIGTAQDKVAAAILALIDAPADAALEEMLAEEREVCALIAENRHKEWNNPETHGEPEVVDDLTACQNIAAAIRARAAKVREGGVW
jgi:hypothetical protein